MSRVLILWGGMEFHEPRQTSEHFARILSARGHEVHVSNQVSKLSWAKELAAFDLIVINMTMGEISDEQEENLLQAVRNGTGLAGWHGGLADAFRSRPNYQYAVGGQWVAHPGDIIEYSVQVEPGHEITNGINDFTMHSEQYYMHVDPVVNVLATTTFSGEHDAWIDGVEMPVAWTKTYGKGRVFYCALGHVAADFDVSEASKLVQQGLRWAIRP